jgi:uncharacterized lipoprotein YddW (UPF0748 family)
LTSPRLSPVAFAALRLLAALAWLCPATIAGEQSLPGAAAPRTPRLGLWIECEGKLRTLDDPARLSAALDHARDLGATDLFVQVYRDGRAWFATTETDDAPWRRAQEKGFDPLRMAIGRAHARGARVHAWVNLLRVGRPSGNRLLRALGDGAILSGTGAADAGDGWRPDTPGAWLDPASPEVGARLAAILTDLLRAYPAVDGIHLDYVRSPLPLRNGRGARPPAFGTTAAAIGRFRKETGRVGPPREIAGGDRAAFEAWRRDRLTDLLRGLRRVLESARPGIVLSAAVMPEPGEAARRAGQDWPRWTEEGILDLVVPMDYATDIVAFDRAGRACVARRGKALMLIGVGAWRMGGNAGAIASRVQRATDLGADGAVLFSHDNLAARRNVFGRLGDLLRAEGIAGRDAAPEGGGTAKGAR